MESKNISNEYDFTSNNDKNQNIITKTIKYSTHHNQHKREPSHRVFVNRSLQLSKIKFFGFDMDYTLALYKSPQYEILAFRLVIEHLVKMGYPEEIKSFEYDPSFPVRGLWYDKLYGHLLKVDTYGNILICVHGFKFLKSNEIRKYYPNKYVNFDETRIFVLNTLFNLPETYLLASLINYFNTSIKYEQHETGVSCGDIFISFKAIYQDVRFAIDVAHNEGKLKALTVENLEYYVIKDERLPILFNRMHENNAKVFLLTNSGYDYTDKIMSYILNGYDNGRHWRTYFDYIVVDAQKPIFFEEGTSLKAINIETGQKSFGSHSGPLLRNQVYSGGSCDVFSKLIGSRGKDVLYVGDHIFGDIIKSKKERAWRTFLVIPELAQELTIWHEKRNLFTKIEELDLILSDMLINLDSSSKQCPDVSDIRLKIQKLIHEMDMQYGLLGSLFRSGSRQTHFASQITRYADIYAATFLNLLHYPFFYLFKAPPMLMPHESTVNPDEEIKDENIIKRQCLNIAPSQSSNTLKLSTTPDAFTTLIKGSKCIEDFNNTIVDSNQTNSFIKKASVSSSVHELENIIHQENELFETENQEDNNRMQRSISVRPDTPVDITHHADFDDDDEESDESK